jgi:GNAT superfamily N-acetyltransferase
MESSEVVILNPQNTAWCSPENAKIICSWVNPESRGALANMLPQNPASILNQMEKGLTRVAVYNGQLIGHITLWLYRADGWGEVGTLISDVNFRGMGIGKMLVSALCQSFSPPHYRLLGTVKTERAKHILCSCGFDNCKFEDLRKMSDSAWRECCPCYSPPENCSKQENGCSLLVRIVSRT